MPEFIESAKKYAEKFSVHHKCSFETGDIRTQIEELKDFDIIIPGAIGPVLGDLFTTLNKLTLSLHPSGYVLLDDGYIPDESTTNYNRCLRKTEFYKQIKLAGFNIIEEIIFKRDAIMDSDKVMYALIEKRIKELIAEYPDKKDIFNGYLKSQAFENDMLANEMVTGTWLLQFYIIR